MVGGGAQDRIKKQSNKYSLFKQKNLAQSAGTAEYTDCISAKGKISPNECPRYEIKQSDGEAFVMLELWEMQSTLLLPSLPSPLWPGVVAPDRALSMVSRDIPLGGGR